jgi:hypothetical protein
MLLKSWFSLGARALGKIQPGDVDYAGRALGAEGEFEVGGVVFTRLSVLRPTPIP